MLIEPTGPSRKPPLTSPYIRRKVRAMYPRPREFQSPNLRFCE